jgi:minor extracellular serine protease Vpr
MVTLIRRGGCTFYVKSKNAQDAGAAGVILYNNTSGLATPTVAGSPPITIPVVFVSDTDGATIDGRIAADPTTTNLDRPAHLVPRPDRRNDLLVQFLRDRC